MIEYINDKLSYTSYNFRIFCGRGQKTSFEDHLALDQNRGYTSYINQSIQNTNANF